MSTDFTGMIAFAQSLAETVKQAQTATEALAICQKQLEDERRILDKIEDERDDLEQECSTHVNSIAALRSELAQAEARNAEVSEALARANAKLDSFRQLLGVDSGASAPQPSGDVQPAVSDRPEPANPAQHVDPAPAGGTGGVEQGHAPQVEWTDVTEQFQPKNDPAPAPEVAEPRPTPQQTGDSHEPSSGPMDDRFGQAQEAAPSGERGPLSWRDSASHVPYRAFSY